MKKAIFTAVFIAAILMVASFAVATPGLKVETDKNVYTIGEDVEISLVNNWNDYIYTGVGYHVTTPNGEIVYNEGWIQIMVGVPPGGSLDYVWDQTYQMSALGDDYAQVAPGHYVIHANHGNGQAHIQVTTEVAFETVEQGTYSGYQSDVSGEYFVIRDDAAWTDFWAEHKSIMFPTPDMPEIDFGSEMIICAFHGVYQNNGAGIVIDSVTNNGDHWEVDVTRATGDGILPVVTNPYHIIKTSYTDLPVEFYVTEIEL